MLTAARLRLLVFAALAFAATAVAVPTFPALTGRVVDDAHLLSPHARAQLNAELAAHERKTTEQVVVVTLPSLQGYPIEDYGYQLGRYWGIGRAKQNNGTLFIVAPKERAVRIEVGYGLEGRLTDALSSDIIHTQVLPQFRQGHYETGVVLGARAILAVLDGTYVPSPKAAQSDRPSVLAVSALFILLVVLALVLLPFLRYAQQPGMYRRGPYDGWGGGGFGGGDVGGGFSGGGGSFGGGGASGRW